VLDGFGHVSVRDEKNPAHFLLSRSMAPGLVTTKDILEYDLEDAPIDSGGRAVYLERFIHAAIYRARPDVRAVVHSHSPSLIAFSVTRTSLRPVYHKKCFRSNSCTSWSTVLTPTTSILFQSACSASFRN
jgi:HCOMODA/2-hydroxy-3-carboxy-muconic semialdehyde decarboxylase